MNKWQTITDMEVNQGESTYHYHYHRPPVLCWILCIFRVGIKGNAPVLTTIFLSAESISQLEPYCSEFLIHAADNEGLQRGVDEDLITKLSQWCSIPVTYAGGGRNLADLDNVASLSSGKVDLTIGSALDCFGGSGVKLDECVAWNRRQTQQDIEQ